MEIFGFLKRKVANKHKPKHRQDSEPETPRYSISGTDRDYSALDDYDVSIKFWLPDIVKTAIEEMTRYAKTTESDLLRQLLFAYIYGRYDLFGLIERGDHRFALTSPGATLFSRAPVDESDKLEEPDLPYLGKNDCDVMIRVASQMKEDLIELAGKQNQPLSVFIRYLLIRHLFGHTFLAEPAMLEGFHVSVEDE